MAEKESGAGLLEELKRRQVPRAAMVYGVVAWLLVQIGEATFEALGLPPGSQRLLIVLLVLGFPVALVAAWLFDVAPTRADDLDDAALEIARLRRGRRVDYVLIALLAAALGLSFWSRSGEPDEASEPLVAPAASDTKTARARGPAIAVLAFETLGAGDQDYFGDGLAEDLVTALSRFPDLRVLSTEATLTFKGGDASATEIARELGARYVVEGSVRRDAGRIRVAARLIDAEGGTHLWAETYDRDLTANALFDVQDDITTRVVGALADPSGVIASVARGEAHDRGTQSLDAYDCVLRAYAYTQRHDEASHLIARDCLERAVELDPGYAEAWAQLAYLAREERQHGFNERPDALERALELAARAERIDSENQTAHYVRAIVYFLLGDAERFRAEAERTVSINPYNGRILGGLAVQLAFSGDWERGLELSERAIELNPFHQGWLHLVLAGSHYRSERYRSALEEAERMDAPFGDLALGHVFQAAIYGQLGHEEEARSALGEALRLDPRLAVDPRGALGATGLGPEIVDQLLDGLRLAGLETADVR